MTILTTMKLEDLGILISSGHIELNNSDLFFGYSIDRIDEYFSQRVGNDGYAIGICGKITETTAEILKSLDSDLLTGEHIILEAQFNEDDCVLFDVSGINDAMDALSYGLSDEEIIEQLNLSISREPVAGRINVVCVPSIRRVGHIRIHRFGDEEMEIQVNDISFVKFDKNDE